MVGQQTTVLADEPEPALVDWPDAELILVVRAMVAGAEQDEVREVGSATVDPVPDVVRLEPAGGLATRVGASAIAQQ